MQKKKNKWIKTLFVKRVMKSFGSEVDKFHQWETGTCASVPCLSLCRSMKYAIKTFVQKPCRDIAEIYLSIRPSIISVLFFFGPHFELFSEISGVQKS